MNTITTQEWAALAVLKSTNVDILEAALVAKEALEAGHGRVKRARKCIAAGAAELQKQEKTVTFAKAVEAALEARKDRRPRTIWDFRKSVEVRRTLGNPSGSGAVTSPLSLRCELNLAGCR